jgi:hypothetical protein
VGKLEVCEQQPTTGLGAGGPHSGALPPLLHPCDPPGTSLLPRPCMVRRGAASLAAATAAGAALAMAPSAAGALRRYLDASKAVDEVRGWLPRSGGRWALGVALTWRGAAGGEDAAIHAPASRRPLPTPLPVGRDDDHARVPHA